MSPDRIDRLIGQIAEGSHELASTSPAAMSADQIAAARARLGLTPTASASSGPTQSPAKQFYDNQTIRNNLDTLSASNAHYTLVACLQLLRNKNVMNDFNLDQPNLLKGLNVFVNQVGQSSLDERRLYQLAQAQVRPSQIIFKEFLGLNDHSTEDEIRGGIAKLTEVYEKMEFSPQDLDLINEVLDLLEKRAQGINAQVTARSSDPIKLFNEEALAALQVGSAARTRRAVSATVAGTGSRRRPAPRTTVAPKTEVNQPINYSEFCDRNPNIPGMEALRLLREAFSSDQGTFTRNFSGKFNGQDKTAVIRFLDATDGRDDADLGAELFANCKKGLPALVETLANCYELTNDATGLKEKLAEFHKRLSQNYPQLFK